MSLDASFMVAVRGKTLGTSESVIYSLRHRIKKKWEAFIKDFNQ